MLADQHVAPEVGVFEPRGTDDRVGPALLELFRCGCGVQRNYLDADLRCLRCKLVSTAGSSAISPRPVATMRNVRFDVAGSKWLAPATAASMTSSGQDTAEQGWRVGKGARGGIGAIHTDVVLVVGAPVFRYHQYVPGKAQRWQYTAGHIPCGTS